MTDYFQIFKQKFLKITINLFWILGELMLGERAKDQDDQY